jgi:putative redox protein
MADEEKATEFAHRPVHVRWLGDDQFEAGRDGQAPIRIDGEGNTAPGPVDTLLAAIATCASVDVVSILGKQRTPAQSLEIRVEATRATSTPRRLKSAVLHFTIHAPGATQAHVERAVELAVNKYCSVRSSLAGDVPVSWVVQLRA